MLSRAKSASGGKKTRPKNRVGFLIEQVKKLVKKLDEESKVVITLTSNGAALDYKTGYKPEDIHKIFKFSADDGDLNGAVDLFFCLRDIFADPRSRYAKQRLEIKLVHGDKYECEDKNCEICKESRINEVEA